MRRDDKRPVLIVFNPTAGRRRRQWLGRALARLDALGCAYRLVETTHRGHAESLARAAGEAVMVAAGGDGTVAEVAAGLLGRPGTLGVLPLGTANVLAWELGLPMRPEAAAEVLVRGEAGLVHPGLARLADGSRRLFVQMLGAGFDAEVVARLDLGLKRRIGQAAYVWQAVRELPRYRHPRLRVVFEDGEAVAGSVVVSNGRRYAGRHLLAPAAEIGRPGFQVVLLDAAHGWATAGYGAALPLGLLPRLPGIRFREAQWLRIEGAEVAVQCDGDPAGRLPVQVEAAPHGLRVMRMRGFDSTGVTRIRHPSATLGP
jgi:diacylglycerol kinase family enzyme